MPTSKRSYLVIVEQQSDVSDESVLNSMEGSLYWVEGVGEIQVVPMGDYIEDEAEMADTLAYHLTSKQAEFNTFIDEYEDLSRPDAQIAFDIETPMTRAYSSDSSLTSGSQINQLEEYGSGRSSQDPHSFTEYFKSIAQTFKSKDSKS